MRFPIGFLASLFGVLLCLVLSFAATSAETTTNDDFHISADAEFFALYKYPERKTHKAIAVGPGGYWAAYSEEASAAEASKLALDACTHSLRTSATLSVRGRDCVLFDVDGKRTGKASPIGIPFGTVAEGPDLPWQHGKEWYATGATKRGTMLLLHGCDGIDLSSGTHLAWINYYRSAGFRVILPNSFAEPRDPAFCGTLGEAEIDQQTRILKQRVAQTLRTVAGIRKQYPGEPLYLHGSSDGGTIAQALGEKVDGIIVTTSSCGFGYSGAYLAAAGVPILVVAGTKDASFPEASTAKGLTKYCQNVTGAGKLTLAAIAGMNIGAPWWSKADIAISKFLKMPTRKITRPSSKGVTFPGIPAEQLEIYAKANQHKAIAAHNKGAWSYNSEALIRLDAEEDALFACDEYAGANAYLDSSLKHECVLVDVNGKRLVK